MGYEVRGNWEMGYGEWDMKYGEWYEGLQWNLR